MRAQTRPRRPTTLLMCKQDGEEHGRGREGEERTFSIAMIPAAATRESVSVDFPARHRAIGREAHHFISVPSSRQLCSGYMLGNACGSASVSLPQPRAHVSALPPPQYHALHCDEQMIRVQ